MSYFGSEAETWKVNIRGGWFCAVFSWLLFCNVGIWGKFSIIRSSNGILNFYLGPINQFLLFKPVTMLYHSHSVKTAASIALIWIKMFLKSKFSDNWELRDEALLNLFSCWWVLSGFFSLSLPPSSPRPSKEKVGDFLSWSLIYLLPFGCIFLYVRYFSLTHTVNIYSMHLDLELTTDI